jgi:hypothetical protein
VPKVTARSPKYSWTNGMSFEAEIVVWMHSALRHYKQQDAWNRRRASYEMPVQLIHSRAVNLMHKAKRVVGDGK